VNCASPDARGTGVPAGSLSERQQRILDVLRGAPDPMSAATISRHLNASATVEQRMHLPSWEVRATLVSLVREGLVKDVADGARRFMLG
jgi:DNA-binding IclR family transcriptional regulator